MNSQQLSHLASLSGPPGCRLCAGRAWALGRRGGRLEVLAGRVWLTRAGELDDHVVEAGQSLRLAGSRGAVVEAWGDGRPAVVAWKPRTAIEAAGDLVRSLVGRARA